jgi:hypothetical protein
MLNVDNFISKENNIFYIDLGSFNEQTDIKLEEGDTVKFKYDDEKYCGTIINGGGSKNGIFQFEKVRKLS